MQGGGGPLLTGTSVQSVSGMSSRIYFGICPTIPVVRNVGLFRDLSNDTGSP